MTQTDEGADPETDAEKNAADAIATGLLRVLRWASVAITLVVLFGLQLPIVLANRDAYSPIEAQLLVIAVFAAVAMVVAVTTWRGKPVGRWRWPLVAAVLLASVTATTTVRPQHRLGLPHWSYGTVGWPLLLLTLGTGISLFAGLLAVHYALTVGQVVLGGQAAVSFAGAVNETVITCGFQFAVGLFAVMLRRIAVSAATTAREEERLRTREAVAEQLHQDRKNRYADLAETTAPLLAGLSSGELDPGDESVRRRCAVEAARMRRLLAETDTAPDPLLHELRACVDLAERNGVSVQFSERGERPTVPKPARHLLTEPAVAALATARSKARVTVAGTGESVTVSVVSDCPPHTVPAVNTEELTTSTVLAEDRIWVEVTWRPRK